MSFGKTVVCFGAKITHLIFSFVFCCSLSLFSQNLSDARMSLIITDITSDATIADIDSRTPMTPASITKLITTATALELLGENFRFATEIFIDGNISDSTLHGNLIVRAVGDPTIGSSYFSDRDFLSRWSDAICRYAPAGISRIEGDIVADLSLFDSVAIPAGWSSPDIGNYYAAGVYGLSFYDNIVAVTFRTAQSGTKPSIIGIYPHIKDFTVVNRLTSKRGVGDNSFFSGVPYSLQRTITGSLEINTSNFIVKADNGNPPLVLLQAFRDTLQQRGISLLGNIRISFDKYYPRHNHLVPLFVAFSPPLADIIRITNVYSNNMFAESLAKYIALFSTDRASFDRGLNVIKTFWSKRGIDIAHLNMLDGSGLTAANTFPAALLNDLLIYMYRHSTNYDVFLRSLPVAGVSGTVRNFLKDTPLAGKAHLKSGSIGGVQCYAGYICKGEKTYSVVVMANGFRGKRRNIVASIEKLILNTIENYETPSP